MIEKLNWKKVALKGLEGAVIAGGASTAATGAGTDVEAIVTNLVCAAIGAAWKAGRNWFDHRADGKRKK